MAIKYRIDQMMSIVYVNLTGEVSDAEFTNAIEMLLHDPKYCPGIDSMIDFRAIERFDVSPQTIHQALAIVSNTLDDYPYPWRMAIVAPSSHVYGISRVYQILREGSMEEVGVFRDAESAREWLGLPEGEVKP
ncbi:MAG: hypothetical protein JXA21_11370 [Anaerolineae bacterium]|nr:hypothetical protein [Anaerolineae bacterium]